VNIDTKSLSPGSYRITVNSAGLIKGQTFVIH